MDKTDAREIAEELSGDTSWLEVLPDCPCEVKDVEKDERFEKAEAGIEKHHPGAATAYRSESVEHINQQGERMNPAQQCAYDSTSPEGKLITHGSGAGTPDSAAAEFPYIEHYQKDVLTWEALGHEEYNQTWKPNNDLNCVTNPPIKEEPPRNELPPEQIKDEEDEMEGALESFIQEGSESSSELDSFIQENSFSELGVESFTESGSAESELAAQTELSSSGF